VVGFPKDLDRQGLAQLLSRAAGISPATAESVLDSLLQAIVVTIAKTGTFTLADFGTFSASQQKARKRRGATPNRTIHFQGSRFGFRAATKLENMVLGKRKRKR
jgi:nucleoid DNA-binding protein